MAESRTERYLNTARALAERGLGVEAIQAMFRLIASEPGYEPAWVFLGLTYCRQGLVSDVPELVDQYQRLSGRGIALVKEIMIELLRASDSSLVEALAEVFPVGHGGHILSLYYAGCARMQQGDDQGALRCFGEFRANVGRYTRLVPFLTDPYLNVIYRQGTLVADCRGSIEEADGAKPEWLGLPTPPLGRPVLVCAANNRYFCQFAQGFVASVAELGLPAVLHFHLLNPDPPSRALAAELRQAQGGIAIDISTADLPPEAGATWFSCSRFLVAPALLEAYGCGLWLFDIDLTLIKGFRFLLEQWPETGRWDVGVMDTGRFEPASRYSAATVFFAARAEARRFLALMAGFVRPHLARPLNVSWMLDQAALYSTVVHCRTALPQISIGEFHHLTGQGLTDILVSLHPAEIKNAMRWNPGGG